MVLLRTSEWVFLYLAFRKNLFSIQNNGWSLKRFFQHDGQNRRLNFLVIFWGVLSVPSFLTGQSSPDSSVTKIIWKARGEISASDLRQGGGKPKLVIAELGTAMRRALELAQQRGFYFAQVDSVARQPETATVFFNSRPRVRFSAAVQSTVNANWAELRNINDETALQQQLNHILVAWARRGYPLANFAFDSVTVAADEQAALATLHLKFNSGPLVRIDSVLIRGNQLTKRAVIARELPVQRGDLYNLAEVESIPERLKRLDFLQQPVALPQLALDSLGRYALQVAVVERNSNLFSGVAGYNPGDDRQKGYVTGLIDVQFGNLFGSGRQLEAHWEKRDRQTQELALRYREPWVAGFPAHVSGGFQQIIRDTSYVERRWDLTAELPLGENFSASGHLARENLTPDSLTQARFNLPASRVTSVGASLRYDSTDDPLNPRRGIFYATTVETGRKNSEIAGTARKNFSRDKIWVDFQWLLPIHWPQVLSLAVHGRQVKSNAPPEIFVTDQFRFGGATTLRGYREEQFRGSRLAWSNLEYRYLLSPRTRAFVFFDAGYYSGFEYAGTATPRQEVENSVYAWGLGARVDTPLGLIGVDYGLGQGDPLTNGKVHISLVNRF